MSALSFPIDPNGNPVGAQVDKGCITCPSGTGFTSDVAINTLERMVNHLLLLGYNEIETPAFPLTDVPTKAADSNQLTGNKRFRYSVGYNDLHRNKFHNPTPSLQTFDVTRELLDQCGGNLATAQMLANANSLGCAPPFGERGISGKRTYGETAVTGVLNMGPFCVTDYADQLYFASHLDAYKRAAVRGIGMMLSYEKIRQYVSMSRKNGAAIAGTRYASFQQSTFPAIPDSAGSFEWLIMSIETAMGGELMSREPVNVSVSPQILKYWVEKYVRDHGIEVRADWRDLRMEAQGYQMQWDGGAFELLSLTRGRKIRISTTYEPVYVEAYATGPNEGEWDFQRYHLLEAGNDADATQATGFFQTGNPFYGMADKFCEGPSKRLCEMILIHAPGAFEYQAFPTNPLGAAIGNVETNWQRLWGATELNIYTGLEVDKYFLEPMNAALAGTGAPCFNNKKNTWFAGEITTGCRFVELYPERMMTLLVQVPPLGGPIETCESIVPCAPPAAIEVTARPTVEPALCTPIPGDPEPDPLPIGCFQPPARLVLNLPCEGGEERTVEQQFVRVGGTRTALTVPFTVTDGTATEGTEFELANGNLVFANGEEFATLDIVLNPTAKPEGVNFLNATIVWDNDPVVICTGGFEETTLCLRLCGQIPAEDPTACPTVTCGDCGNETPA
jgi:hypothetical protein